MNVSSKEPKETHPGYGSECGQQHGDCPNSWQGSCDREAGHDGSHHCSRCNAAF